MSSTTRNSPITSAGSACALSTAAGASVYSNASNSLDSKVAAAFYLYGQNQQAGGNYGNRNQWRGDGLQLCIVEHIGEREYRAH